MTAPYLLTPALSKGVGVFDISTVYANDGFDFDFSMTDRFFQNEYGGAVATDAGQNVGLAMDDHSWAGATLEAITAAAPDLMVNGTFAADASFTKGAGWTIGSGIATHAAGSSSSLTSTAVTATAGKLYRAQYDILNSANIGALVFAIGASGSGLARNANGLAYVDYVSALGGTNIFIFGGNTFSGAVDNLLLKMIPGNHAQQGTGSFQPKRQAGNVLRFDGSDDNLLTTYLAQTGPNCIFARVAVPASIGSTQVIVGASGAAANRCFLGINTSGELVAGVGSDSVTTIRGATDRRGQTIVVGLAFDGATVRLFDDSLGAVYEAAQSGTPTTSIPFRIGALNNNGTAGSFFGGDIKGRLIVGRQMVTAAQFASIRSQLLAL